jgi:hypothetical protein
LLNNELASWRDQSFAWGTYDCLGFCRRTGIAICGEDPLGDLPHYHSERSAIRELRKLGFSDAIELVSAHLNEIPPSLARRGDWVLIPTPSALGCAFGVNAGRRSAHMGLEGLVMIEASASARAWRVGV